MAQHTPAFVLPQCDPSHQTLLTTYPRYLYQRLSSEFPYNTRLAQSDKVRIGPEFKAKLELTQKSFVNRATVSYNKLPTNLRQTTEIRIFKKKLKAWVQKNVII